MGKIDRIKAKEQNYNFITGFLLDRNEGARRKHMTLFESLGISILSILYIPVKKLFFFDFVSFHFFLQLRPVKVFSLFVAIGC